MQRASEFGRCRSLPNASKQHWRTRAKNNTEIAQTAEHAESFCIHKTKDLSDLCAFRVFRVDRWPRRSPVNAWRFVAGSRDVIQIGPWVCMRVRIDTTFTSQFEHAITQAAQELPVM